MTLNLDTLFANAHTYTKWQDTPVDNSVLKQAYDYMKWAPTSVNCSPLRIVFIKSDAEKQRLKPFLAKGNVEKTMAAPVTAILAMDMTFHNHLPKLFPHTDAKSWFDGNDDYIADTAYRNSSLQAGYFILAARAVGLDCGPMSGFDNDKLDAEYFSDNHYKSNVLVNLGYGQKDGYHPRTPRFDFDEICRIV